MIASHSTYRPFAASAGTLITLLVAYDKIKIALALGPLTQLELEVINDQ